MRIVYIYRDFSSKGGLERILCEKASALADMGLDVHIVCSSRDGRQQFAYPLDHRVHVHDIGLEFAGASGLLTLPFEWLRFKYIENRALGRMLDRLHADVVVATPMWMPASTFGNKRKVVIESHLSRNMLNAGSKLPSIHRFFNNIAEKKAAAIVTLTNEEAALWSKGRRTVVIPNFTSIVCGGRPAAGTRRAIAVGRLHEQKDFGMLVEAWTHVARSHPDWSIDIYGEGPDRAMLQKLIRDARLEHAVRLQGNVHDIKKEYASHDFLVLCSKREGLPLVLIEAMTCGCPCISVDCECGPREIIADGDDGLLVPYRSHTRDERVRSLSDAICKMIDNPDMLARFSDSGRRNVERFNKASIMRQWIDLFEEVAG